MAKAQFPVVGAEIADLVTAFYTQNGMDPDKAKQEGQQIAELFLTTYAGERLKFPQSSISSLSMIKRNRSIRHQWDGTNANILAKRYNLSRARIWQIVKLPASND